MEEITIKDVARLSGVGVSTVSRAINNHPDINPETKEKVMRIIEEYNYVPNNSARNLKRQESKTIAVLIKGISNPFFLSMLKPLEDFVDREHFDYIIQRVTEEEDEVSIAMQLEKEKRLRGLIFLGGNFDHAETKMKNLSSPFVLCTLGKLEGVSLKAYSSVSIDDFTEGYKMTDYLIGLGHKRILILGGRKMDDVSIGQRRRNGYRKALKDHGIEVDETLICPMLEEYIPYSMDNGYFLMKQIMESNLEFTAVFALSDEMAIGASKAILESGKKIPGDYAVASFDGTSASKYYHPSLTTIKQPGDEMMTEAARILFDLIYERDGNQHKTFDAQLVVGESTIDIN